MIEQTYRQNFQVVMIFSIIYTPTYIIIAKTYTLISMQFVHGHCGKNCYCYCFLQHCIFCLNPQSARDIVPLIVCINMLIFDKKSLSMCFLFNNKSKCKSNLDPTPSPIPTSKLTRRKKLQNFLIDFIWNESQEEKLICLCFPKGNDNQYEFNYYWACNNILYTIRIRTMNIFALFLFKCGYLIRIW